MSSVDNVSVVPHECFNMFRPIKVNPVKDKIGNSQSQFLFNTRYT